VHFVSAFCHCEAELPINALFLATGNNLVFWGDLTTRAIVSTFSLLA